MLFAWLDKGFVGQYLGWNCDLKTVFKSVHCKDRYFLLKIFSLEDIFS